MLKHVKIPQNQITDLFEVESFVTETAIKLNEVINFLNNGNQVDNNLTEELKNLIERWKKEANDLLDKPDLYQGTSIEVRKAVSQCLLEKYVELYKLLNGEI